MERLSNIPPPPPLKRKSVVPPPPVKRLVVVPPPPLTERKSIVPPPPPKRKIADRFDLPEEWIPVKVIKTKAQLAPSPPAIEKVEVFIEDGYPEVKTVFNGGPHSHYEEEDLPF